MPWAALPVELVVRILEALDPHALLNCRRTSRLLKSLIDDTVALQYHIALHSSGMADGPPGRLSPSERLSLLRSYETSWKSLDWNEHNSFPVPASDGSLWELYGNVWAHSRGDDIIDFVQIPSRLRGIPLRQWTLRLDFPLRDFSMDPSQDLLVTIERATNALLHYRIRLLTLSTGEEHRLARDTATLEHLPADPRIHWSYSIRISGDYVGILLINNGDVGDDDSDRNELVVWSWKTGVQNLRVTLVGMVSFIFLGKDFVLASTSTSPPLDYEQPSLLLYSLDHRLDRSVETPLQVLRFLFPATPPTYGHSVITLTSDPSPGWSTSPGLQVPFQNPCDERLIAIGRFYRGFPSSETFLVPASTLLKHIGNTKIEGEGCEPLDIQWESWGPTSAVPLQGRWSVYTCFVFGMRHILPSAALRDDIQVGIVRDLCPRRCRRANEEERKESNALHRAMKSKEPYPSSIVKCIALPRSIRVSSTVDLMISEDGIVAFEERDDTSEKLIHFLTF